MWPSPEYHSRMSQDRHTGGSRLSRSALSWAFFEDAPKGVPAVRVEVVESLLRITDLADGGKMGNPATGDASKSRTWKEICSRGTCDYRFKLFPRPGPHFPEAYDVHQTLTMSTVITLIFRGSSAKSLQDEDQWKRF